MSYRLGIDLGTSSLGWCCLKTDNEETTEILDMGVRIFSDGRNDKSKEPLCVARREARSSRRRLKRFKLRQKQLIADLQEANLFPTDKETLKELEKENPYELRTKALHEQLTPYQIGRAIFHLNQRRGFLSNRQEDKQAETKDLTKTQMAMEKLTSLIQANNCLTLGEYMYKTGVCRFKNSTAANGKLIITTYPNRDMYKNEFDLIWKTQKKYYPEILTDELKTRLRDYDIFYQRPLKKQETGFCSLEPEERRCPKAYPIAQEFRIRSEIANLSIVYPEERKLTKDEYEKLFDSLNMPQAKNYDKNYIVSFEKIIKLLNLPDDTIFNLMTNNRKGLLCNITNAILCLPDTFGSTWASFPEKTQEEIIDILEDYSLQRDAVSNKLLEIVPQLSKQDLNTILEQSLLLPDGYVNLSATAMHKLATEMEQSGVDYTSAVMNVYHKDPNQLRVFPNLDELPKYQELFSEQLIGADRKNYIKEWDYDNYMGRITNVSVHIALNQLRQVVNELIRRYGKPDGITIELGRELTKGKKALNEIEKRQKENAQIMAEAREAIRKRGVSITPFNIEKYKVWRNLNPKDATKRVDLYTGKNICIDDLFNSDYEIEHILPYSWSYDDSYNNKIITRAKINRQKSNQLPYDFFTNPDQISAVTANEEEQAKMSLERVKERAKDIDKARGNLKKTFNFNAIAWRFSKNARDIFNRNNKNMARDLTDMQYMSKLARKYLTCICDESKIVSAKGQMTDQLKKVWEITDTLPQDHQLWTVQKWQRQALFEKEQRHVKKINPSLDEKTIAKMAQANIDNLSESEIQNRTSVSKDRTIHYHHALDAFTLANITPKIVQFISSKDFANKAEAYQAEKNNKPENEKYITLGEAQTTLLKQSGKFYSKPYPNFDKEAFAQQLSNLTISYKEPLDKLKLITKKAAALEKDRTSFSFAAINQASAFGFRRVSSIEKDDIKIEFSIRKNSQKVYETKSLSTMVPVFRTQEQKAEFHRLYPIWRQATVRREALGKNKYQEIEAAFFNTFTKDKAFKWYESNGNYAAQIYQINKHDKFVPNKKENWSLEIISNYYAFERQGKFFWKDIYPTAKLITTIRINDVIEATFQANDDLKTGFNGIQNWVKDQFKKHPDKQELKLLFRVKKLGANRIYLRPLHIAQEDGDTKSWGCSITKFQQYHCRKVYVSATGKVIGG